MYDIDEALYYFCRIFYKLDMIYLFELVVMDVIRLFWLSWDAILLILYQFQFTDK